METTRQQPPHRERLLLSRNAELGEQASIEATGQDVYLYHANPYGNRDGMRQLIGPSLFVDIADKIGLKEDMLRQHATQKDWLDVSRARRLVPLAMRDMCRGGADGAEAGGVCRGLPTASACGAIGAGWRQAGRVSLGERAEGGQAGWGRRHRGPLRERLAGRSFCLRKSVARANVGLRWGAAEGAGRT